MWNENRINNCRSKIEKLRVNDRKSSISLLIKPYNSDSRSLALNRLGDSTNPDRYKRHGYSQIEQELSRTTKGNERETSNLRSKSNVNQNKHVQIRHEPLNLNSMATFQKLIDNFPDIQYNSKENIKERDIESIERKADELK